MAESGSEYPRDPALSYSAPPSSAPPSRAPSSAPPYIAIVGPSEATPEQLGLARAVGLGCAEAGAVVVTGGLGGVMQAACEGARHAGGVTVGILPGSERSAANPYLTVALPTGMGELRNGLVARSADSVIAIGGSWGTLSEIALAVRIGKTVVGLDSWSLPERSPNLIEANSASEAVAIAVAEARLPGP